MKVKYEWDQCTEVKRMGGMWVRPMYGGKKGGKEPLYPTSWPISNQHTTSEKIAIYTKKTNEKVSSV